MRVPAEARMAAGRPMRAPVEATRGQGFAGIFEISGDMVPSFNVGLWAPDGRRTDGPAVGGEIVPSGIRAWPNGILTLNNAGCHYSEGRQREFLVLRRFDPALRELA